MRTIWGSGGWYRQWGSSTYARASLGGTSWQLW